MTEFFFSEGTASLAVVARHQQLTQNHSLVCLEWLEIVGKSNSKWEKKILKTNSLKNSTNDRLTVYACYLCVRVFLSSESVGSV